MNKGDLVKHMAEKAGITQAQAGDALAAALDAVGGAVRNGDKVTLIGFGTFSRTVRAARDGRNPSTGKAIKIPAKNQVKFKAGKELDDSLNK
jgi:DNA-binding protein HU-beta